MRCGHCGKVIREAQFVRFDKRNYHLECYRRYVQPRCDFCQKPIEGECVQYERRVYHRDCFQNHVAPRCALCGGVIEGKLLKDFWGNSYHPRHENREAQCDYCKRFISSSLTGGGKTLKDGRRICNLCLRSVVQDGRQARELLQQVARDLHRHGIFVDLSRCGFSLIDRERLSRISGQQRNRIEETGFTHYQSVKRLVTKSVTRGMSSDVVVDKRHSSVKIDIYVLTVMPEMHFISTAAHEIMHVWQYLNAPLENDKALCEGSCNYASYLILREYCDETARFLIESFFKSKNRYYGQGFRHIHRYVERHGIKSWLSHLRKSSHLPRG